MSDIQSIIAAAQKSAQAKLQKTSAKREAVTVTGGTEVAKKREFIKNSQSLASFGKAMGDSLKTLGLRGFEKVAMAEYQDPPFAIPPTSPSAGLGVTANAVDLGTSAAMGKMGVDPSSSDTEAAARVVQGKPDVGNTVQIEQGDTSSISPNMGSDDPVNVRPNPTSDKDVPNELMEAVKASSAAHKNRYAAAYLRKMSASKTVIPGHEEAARRRAYSMGIKTSADALAVLINGCVRARTQEINDPRVRKVATSAAQFHSFMKAVDVNSMTKVSALQSMLISDKLRQVQSSRSYSAKLSSADAQAYAMKLSANEIQEAKDVIEASIKADSTLPTAADVVTAANVTPLAANAALQEVAEFVAAVGGQVVSPEAQAAGASAPPTPGALGAVPPGMGGVPGPPMNPGMQGGAPPMDPSMMGGAPPMDPSMMGGAPPMDPSMMGGAPAQAPPPQDPAQGQAPPAEETSKQSQAHRLLANMRDLMKRSADAMAPTVPETGEEEGKNSADYVAEPITSAGADGDLEKKTTFDSVTNLSPVPSTNAGMAAIDGEDLQSWTERHLDKALPNNSSRESLASVLDTMNSDSKTNLTQVLGEESANAGEVDAYQSPQDKMSSVSDPEIRRLAAALSQTFA